MESFQPMVDLALGSTPALCFHGSPKSYDDSIFATTPDEELRPLLVDIGAPVLLGGHTHLQVFRRYEDSVIVNPGSVGLPFRAWWPRPVRISPWAEYGIVGGGRRAPEHRLAAHAVRRRRVHGDEPRVGHAAR
jgi:predicted phosphodiesterase